jgi:hypothetical protein
MENGHVMDLRFVMVSYSRNWTDKELGICSAMFAIKSFITIQLQYCIYGMNAGPPTTNTMVFLSNT